MARLLVGLESRACCLGGVMLRRGGQVRPRGFESWALYIDRVQKMRRGAATALPLRSLGGWACCPEVFRSLMERR